MIITTVRNSAALEASPLARMLPQNLFKAVTRSEYKVIDVVSPLRHKRVFYSDAGLGANNPKSDNHFVNHNLSTDTPSAIRKLFKHPEEGYEAKIEQYKAAFKAVHGRLPQNHEIMEKRPWEVLKFSDRSVLERFDVPYVQYYRQAVVTALERGGKVHFYLGGIDINDYVRSIINAEKREQKPFSDFAAEVSFGKLVNAGRGEQFAFYAGVVGHGSGPTLEQPKITSVELFDSTAGKFRDIGRTFKYYAEDDTLLDTGRLLDLQEKVLEMARSKENLDSLRADKGMTPDTQHLIDKLQRYFTEGR